MNSLLTTQLTPQLIAARQKLALLEAAAQERDSTSTAGTEKNPIDPAILKALADAKKAWEALPENQAKLQAMRQMGLHELVKALREISRDPIFAPAFAMGQHRGVKSASDDLSGDIGSFSVGLAGQVDLGVGVTGTLGYAFDPNDETQFSVFLSVGVVGGPDAELDAGVELGAWTSSPTQMTGFMVGAGMGLDPDGFGASGAGFVSCDLTLLPPSIIPNFESWGAALTLSLGEGGGLLAVLSFTLVIITESIPPIAQPNADHMIMISSIKCVQKQDNDSDKDELYMLFQIDGNDTTFPFPTWSHFSIPEGGTWNCGRSIKLNNSVNVTLMNGGDTIDSWAINFSNLQSSYSCNYKDGMLNQVAYTMYVSKVY